MVNTCSIKGNKRTCVTGCPQFCRHGNLQISAVLSNLWTCLCSLVAELKLQIESLSLKLIFGSQEPEVDHDHINGVVKLGDFA